MSLVVAAGLGVAAAGVGAAGVNYVLPHVVKRRQVVALRALCARTRTMCLTYDDGPSPLTAPLLERLGAGDARATFFVTAAAADRSPALLDRIRAAGHEIGAHSHAHLHAWRVAPWRAHRDAVGGLDALGARLSTPALLRPAYGKITATTWLALARRDARLAWWTVDAGDTFATPERGRAERLVARDGGGVVLLHDLARGGGRDELVLDTTEALLELARREGLAVRPLGELLAAATAGRP